ncbi:MAG: hypothetical protein KA368_20890 [Acidobacteria bacterium]|nr:hypothetical protein [Acidobacteriota bacterium]
MTRKILAASLSAAFLLMQGCSSSSSESASHRWVSASGDDSNPCSHSAPCKTFAQAFTQTPVGGEIGVIDSGSFGEVSITKPITINGQGATIIVAPNLNGFVVNAGANDVVTIKNLSMVGAGSAANAIRYIAGNQLTVETVAISGFGGNGVEVELGKGGQATGGGKLILTNSSISNCGKSGFKMSTASGFATATLDNIRLNSSTNGVEIGDGNTFTLLNRSSITSNTASGILAAAASAVINADNSIIAFNGVGVNAAAATTVRLSGNGIYHNGEGLKISGGATVSSDGTNRIEGNGSTQMPNGIAKRQ